MTELSKPTNQNDHVFKKSRYPAFVRGASRLRRHGLACGRYGREQTNARFLEGPGIKPVINRQAIRYSPLDMQLRA